MNELTDAHKSKARKLALRLVQAHDAGDVKAARLAARLLARLGVSELRVREKE